jgi:hypothetical protein
MADTRTKAPPAHFTEAEAADIIREASTHALRSQSRERTLTREEVLAMAREMGVSEASVEVALAARGQNRTESAGRVRLLEVWKQEMRSSSAPSPPFQNVSRKVFISRSTSSWLVSQT